MRNPLRAGLVVVALVFALAACAEDEAAVQLEVGATIDGVSIDDATSTDPLALDPRVESELELTVTNPGDTPVTVGHARLEGEMLGLTFLTYDTRLLLELGPGETRTLAVPLDFFDLEEQAHGYLRTWLRLYDDTDRTRVANEEFVLDIRGNAFSTMTVFALLLLLVTAASAAHNLWSLRRNQLPPNRFARGARFAVTGLGVGLLLSVAFSVLRVFPLPASGWIPLTLLPTIVGFALGYLSPGAADPDAEDDDDDAFALDEDLAT